MSEAACCGCGGCFTDMDGPTHPYMLSSPGCWHAYGALLAREYADPALFAACHRLTVDASALQHPGDAEDPRATRSVWLHFASLHAIFAHGYSLDRATQLLQRLAGRAFEPLPNAAPDWSLTLASLSGEQGEHTSEMRRWARASYDEWYASLAAACDRLM